MFGANVPVPLELHIPVPVLDVPFKVTTELFAQTVWFGPALTTAGALITTLIVDCGLTHPADEVMVRLYVPAAASVTFAMEGF